MASDWFGLSVAVSGSTVVVGAPYRSGWGVAYLFAQSGAIWGQQQEVMASDGAVHAEFGQSVAADASSSTAVVGASLGSNQMQGASYVFSSSGPLYTLSASPSSLSVEQGGQGTSTITVTPWNGFGGSVSFSAPGLPNGVTAAFDPNPAASVTTLTLTASDHAASGTTPVLPVVGASGNLAQTIWLSLTVTGATTVSLSPISLSFGDEAANTNSGAKTVTLKNTGSATLDISSIAFKSGINFAISSNTCGSTLAKKSSCKVSVIFAPTELGALTDTLSFVDAAPSSPQTVSLSGTGVAQTTLTPASVTFANTKVGKTSAAHKFTLKNNLPTTLTGISCSTAAPFAVSTTTCGTWLDSKKSCTISVTFSPTTTGTFNGTLTVNDGANDSPQTASLSGTGD